ncbi:MAG: hypothetical protein OXG98_01970 [Gemmatimonadetes bacterium]|nr:hypothetical protein [Gemmatimonadota bacterium]
MTTSVSKIVFSVINLKSARAYDLLQDIDCLINVLKNTAEILNDPLVNRDVVWEHIKDNVERVKLYGNPISDVIEEWGASHEWNQEVILADAIEAGLKGETAEPYEELPEFVKRKTRELYEIRKIAGRPLIVRLITGGVVMLLILGGVSLIRHLW